MTGSLLFGPILTYSHLSNFWLCECRCRATILVSSQVLQLAWLGAMTCRTCTAFIKLLFQSKDLLGESWFLSNYPNDLILSDFDTCPHWICTNAFDLPCFSKERDLRARVLRILWNAILQRSPKNQTILRYGREGTLWWEQVVCKKARSQHSLQNAVVSKKLCVFVAFVQGNMTIRCRRKREAYPAREATRRLSLHKVSKRHSNDKRPTRPLQLPCRAAFIVLLERFWGMKPLATILPVKMQRLEVYPRNRAWYCW